MIAETVRLRRDLAVIDADTDLVRNLAVLTGHRSDLIADRVRMINRLRELMTSGDRLVAHPNPVTIIGTVDSGPSAAARVTIPKETTSRYYLDIPD